MFYIEQTEGTRVTAANDIRLAAELGEFARARAIFERVTGERMPSATDDAWWAEAAPIAIQRFVPRHITDTYPMWREEYFSARAAADHAERELGGRWAVRFGY
jgi:hypothetical protein